MKPPIFDKMVINFNRDDDGNLKPVVDGNIPKYSGISGTKLEDSGIEADRLLDLSGRSSDIIAHINDGIGHISPDEKRKMTEDLTNLENHLVDYERHVTPIDREKWDAKETPAQAQAKADAVQSNLNLHINDLDVHVTPNEKQLLNNGIYSKEEVDNKIAAVTTGLDWKESVQTYADLFIKYPEPKEGWTVNVLDDGITYRYTIPKDVFDLEGSGYTEADLDEEFAKHHTIVWVESMGYYKKWNGTAWITTADIGSWEAISANAIKLATADNDGLFSKGDFVKLRDIEPHANYYEHPTGDAYNHITTEQLNELLKMDNSLKIGDPIITTDAEGFETYYFNGIFTPNERTKLALIEDNANYYVHPESHPAEMITESINRRFITTEQLESLGNMATKALASTNVDGLMSKEMYSKLAGIDYLANNYIHPVTHPATMIETNPNARFVTDIEKEAITNPPVVTAEKNGAMSAEDKVKFDNLVTEEFPKLKDELDNLDKCFEGDIASFDASGVTRIDIRHHLDTEHMINVVPISLDGTNPYNNISGNIWVEPKEDHFLIHATLIDTTKETKFSYFIYAL